MEFLDEDARPRFVFQSGAPTESEESEPNRKPTKPFLFVTVALSSILFALSLFFLQSEPYKSLLFWLSLSLLIGPFAPLSLTAGDIRVGRGHIVHFPDQEPATDDDPKKQQRRSKTRRSEDVAVGPVAAVANDGVSGKRGSDGNGAAAVLMEEEEKEWNEEDLEVLKKQMVKHPVGKPGRWEAIATAFGGRHRAESVIKMAKELGEKRVDDSDSYALFLKKRKMLDKRVENGGEDLDVTGEKAEADWSSAEDIALLNALKVFPKDASMRWEKVAAAVPGKSKAACIKRVAELKKGFRSAKAAGQG